MLTAVAHNLHTDGSYPHIRKAICYVKPYHIFCNDDGFIVISKIHLIRRCVISAWLTNYSYHGVFFILKDLAISY